MEKIYHRAYMSLDDAKTRVKELVTTMKSVVNFKIGNPIKGFIDVMACHIEAGKSEDAIKQAAEILSVGRSILSKFLRNSIIGQQPKEGEEGTKIESFFNKEIHLLVQEGYDEDLVARMNKYRNELEDAVRIELDADFSKRVTTYNTMVDVLTEVYKEQTMRDRVRHVRDEACKKAKWAAKDQQTTEQNAIAAQTQRQRVLAERKQEADELRGLLA